MSQAFNPVTQLVLADPSQPNSTHPMVSLAPNNTQPFTLLKNPGVNQYSWTFNNQTRANVRVYMIGFTTSEDNPLWTYTNSVVVDSALTPVFRDTDLRSSTSLWVGAWWDNGTYGANADGVKAYFRSHPNATGHHTVPVIVG